MLSPSDEILLDWAQIQGWQPEIQLICPQCKCVHPTSIEEVGSRSWQCDCGLFLAVIVSQDDFRDGERTRTLRLAAFHPLRLSDMSDPARCTFCGKTFATEAENDAHYAESQTRGTHYF